MKRKFRELDQETSYFDGDDDDEEPTTNSYISPVVDELAAQDAESELHRTPRMFSLAQAPLLNSGPMNGSFADRKDVDGESKEALS